MNGTLGNLLTFPAAWRWSSAVAGAGLQVAQALDGTHRCQVQAWPSADWRLLRDSLISFRTICTGN